MAHTKSSRSRGWQTKIQLMIAHPDQNGRKWPTKRVGRKLKSYRRSQQSRVNQNRYQARRDGMKRKITLRDKPREAIETLKYLNRISNKLL